jgi:hypothetical protein
MVTTDGEAFAAAAVTQFTLAALFTIITPPVPDREGATRNNNATNQTGSNCNSGG